MWAGKNLYGIPQETIEKIRTFEKYSRNFEPIERALSNLDFGSITRWDRYKEIYRGRRCCIPLTEVPKKEVDQYLWYEGEVECGADGQYLEPLKPLGFGRFIARYDSNWGRTYM